MTGPSLWILHQASRLLEADERDAVLGDFLESGASFAVALSDVVGLITRRQLALWKEGRTWLAFCGVVVPVSALLFHVTARVVFVFHLYYWIFENYRHFDPNMLEEMNYTLEHGLAVVLRHASLLILWSWASGFVLASVARRAVWANLTTLACLGGLVLWATWGMSSAPEPSFVLAVSLGFVAAPLALGVKQGLSCAYLTPRSARWLAMASVLLTSYAVWSGGWWRAETPHLVQLSLTAVLSWPIGYIVLTSAARPEPAEHAA